MTITTLLSQKPKNRHSVIFLRPASKMSDYLYAIIKEGFCVDKILADAIL
jgi:hypothetical protein